MSKSTGTKKYTCTIQVKNNKTGLEASETIEIDYLELLDDQVIKFLNEAFFQLIGKSPEAAEEYDSAGPK
jgi:hypothetical protein